jgi:uncharacterized protein YdeI (YjbR/CyaY-like superfamily)
MTQHKFKVKLIGHAGTQKIINSDAKAKEFWPKLSFTHQKEYVREIDGAKGPETREKGIVAMMDALRRNHRKGR